MTDGSTHDHLEDDNESILRSIAGRGADLSAPVEVEFPLVFPHRAGADAAAVAAGARGFEVELLGPDAEDGPDAEWAVFVQRTMVPTAAAITAIERTLVEIAADCGGRSEGWGFLQDPADPDIED